MRQKCNSLFGLVSGPCIACANRWGNETAAAHLELRNAREALHNIHVNLKELVRGG
jgi:hypothetical protein